MVRPPHLNRPRYYRKAKASHIRSPVAQGRSSSFSFQILMYKCLLLSRTHLGKILSLQWGTTTTSMNKGTLTWQKMPLLHNPPCFSRVGEWLIPFGEFIVMYLQTNPVVLPGWHLEWGKLCQVNTYIIMSEGMKNFYIPSKSRYPTSLGKGRKKKSSRRCALILKWWIFFNLWQTLLTLRCHLLSVHRRQPSTTLSLVPSWKQLFFTWVGKETLPAWDRS